MNRTLNNGPDKSLLEYRGQLTSEVRLQLLDLLKCIALFNLGPRTDHKKLVGIALELLDNAQRYNSSNDIELSWTIANGELVITITNKASSRDAHRLLETVERISRMDPEEISAEFKRQLTNGSFGDSGGAGLGMLQIARKAGRNISARIEATVADEFLCTSKVITPLDRTKAI